MRVVVLSLLSLCATAQAVPLEVSTSGRLLDSLGAPITGEHDLTFELWLTQTGGADPDWDETQYDVNLNDGYYSVILGASGSLDGQALAGDRWLRVLVDGVAVGDRQPLTSVPFARVAAQVKQNDGTPVIDSDGTIHVSNPSTCTPGVLRYDADQLYVCNDSAEWTEAGGGALLGASSDTAAPTCKHILDAGGHGSGTYWIDPTGSDPFQVWCDMETDGGGWTLCGKYHRDGPGNRYLNSPWGRAADNRGDLATLYAFTGRQASQDCRELIRQGATEILSAGAGSSMRPYFDDGRITTILAEVIADPTNLWDVTLDDESPEGAVCTQNAITTYDLGHNDVGGSDGSNSLAGRSAMVGDGAMWTVRNRVAAHYSNAGTASNLCDGTTNDTVFWSWRTNGPDDHGCASTVFGTGCSTANATYRYNYLLMR